MANEQKRADDIVALDAMQHGDTRETRLRAAEMVLASLPALVDLEARQSKAGN